MTESEALAKMIAPGTRRPGKYREGVIQVWVTRACDKACFACTQGSNLGGKPGFITLDQFRLALESLKGYFGVVGVFGGNPAMHPQFIDLCRILRISGIPKEQCGIWCNNPLSVLNAAAMRIAFNPAVSNLNVHLDREAFNLFKAGWPECNPVGLHQDSRHGPVHLAMKDVIADEGKRWELISGCDLNRHWSAMIGVFRGELRAWFCEVAGAQAMLHQDEPDYPDTGIALEGPGIFNARIQTCFGDAGVQWWQLPMRSFAHQVRKHCHECAVPLRGYGQLAMATEGTEQTSGTHAAVFKPKRKGRPVEVVTDLVQLGVGRITRATDYLGNSQR